MTHDSLRDKMVPQTFNEDNFAIAAAAGSTELSITVSEKTNCRYWVLSAYILPLPPALSSPGSRAV